MAKRKDVTIFRILIPTKLTPLNLCGAFMLKHGDPDGEPYLNAPVSINKDWGATEGTNIVRLEVLHYEHASQSWGAYEVKGFNTLDEIRSNFCTGNGSMLKLFNVIKNYELGKNYPPELAPGGLIDTMKKLCLYHDPRITWEAFEVLGLALLKGHTPLFTGECLRVLERDLSINEAQDVIRYLKY